MEAKLFPYQRVATDFIKSKKRVGLFLDIGLGKAIDDDTIIPTPNGERRVGDIQVGDRLFAIDGQPTRVKAVYKHTDKKSYRVTLSDKRSFICCDEHLISFYDTYDKRFESSPLLETKPLCDLYDDVFYAKGRYALPHVEPVVYEKQDVPYPAYSYGHYLAMMENGKTIPLHDQTVITTFLDEQTNEPHPSHSEHRDYFVYGGNIPTDVTDHFKRYEENDIKTRTACLDGFFDNSAHVRHTRNGRPVYVANTTHEDVALFIATIGRSLGYKMVIDHRTEFDERRRKRCTLYYVTCFTRKPIGLQLKNHTTFIQYGQKHTFKRYDELATIEQVEPLDVRPMTCFTIEHARALFCINDYIMTHNTLVTLTALYELAMEGKLSGNILIIAPKRIAKMTWADEIQKWDHTKNMRYTVITGMTKAKKEALLRDIPNRKAALYSINREIVPAVVEFYKKEGIPFPFQTIVIDEAQSFKSYKSKRFKALKDVSPYVDRIVELTGSPAPNGLQDIWSLIYMLDNGVRLGRTITQYRETFYYPGRTINNQPYEWFLKDHAEAQIHHLISDLVISMMKKDYLTLPPITHNVIELEMSNKERAVYDKLKKEKVLEITETLEVAPGNAAVLLGALLQLSNGAIYANDIETGEKHILTLHDHKLDALEEIIEGSNGQPILIFAWYQHDVQRITERFKDVEVFGDNPVQLERWNRGEIPILLAHPASAGHGLNFQYGGHILVFFVVPQSLELYEQSIGRLYRNGQDQPVIVHYLMVRDTVEEKVIRTLREKQDVQNRLIDAVRAEVNTLKP